MENGHRDSALPGANETHREALANFLRERREALAPEQVGIASHRGRRTPGLRREEVAFLADIGVKWYARLEAGADVHPSAATLTGIAAALRLSNAELEYLLDLAGLRAAVQPSGDLHTISPPLRALVSNLHGVSAMLSDRILTPLLWNAAGEAMHNHSRFSDPVDRNALVRALFDPPFITFLGPEREPLVEHAVGMFRLNYSSASPSPYAAGVYDRVKSHPLFRQAWKHRVVAAELTGETTGIRIHPTIGKLSVYAIDLSSAIRSDFLLRVLIPEDDETKRKFARLEAAGGGRGALWQPSRVTPLQR